ncbi:MAG: ATP-dependent Clp protease adaptor ClpS [Dehalococcoidia bacterium]
MTTAPDVKTPPRVADWTQILPPYSVILHNDDVNEMLYVVHSLLVCVPELGAEQATSIMVEAHINGKAVVITCPLERAELYRDRLRSRGLSATIERA